MPRETPGRGSRAIFRCAGSTTSALDGPLRRQPEPFASSGFSLPPTGTPVRHHGVGRSASSPYRPTSSRPSRSRARMARLLPGIRMFVGSHPRHAYVRRSRCGGRLLFGGRASARPIPLPLPLAADILWRMIERLFESSAPGLDYSNCWTGFVAFTGSLLPHIAERRGVFHAGGYCGSGVAPLRTTREQRRHGACDGRSGRRHGVCGNQTSESGGLRASGFLDQNWDRSCSPMP